MLLNRLFRSRKARQPVKPITLHSRWNAAILRLEALDERVVPSFADPVIYPVGSGAGSLAAADFTGDGIIDLATNTFTSGHGSFSYQVGVLAGNGDGSFQPAQLSPSPGGSLLAGDLDGDGKADLITASDKLNVLISNGNGTFQPAQPVTLPRQTPPDYTGEPLAQSVTSAVVGDVNADGHLDLVVTGTTYHTNVSGPGPYGGYYYETVLSTYANVLIGTGLSTFDHGESYFLENHPNVYIIGLDVGDFNGDSNLDFLTSYFFSAGGNDVYSALWARLGNGDGTFQLGSTGGWGNSHFLQHAVADFNRDGKTDVLIGGEAYATATVALGNADGTFTPMSPFDAGSFVHTYWTLTEVGDVNGDGTFDLVFVERSSGNRASVVLGDCNGTFARPETYDFGARSYDSFTLADFDGDGLSDLAATDWNTGVIVHMNTGGWSPPAPSLRITDASATEGNLGTRDITFTVTLTHAATEPVTVQYATANGTATSGSDYQATGGTVVIAAGEMSGTFTVPVIGDRLPEPNETFFVNLSGANNAIISDGQAEGTIVDDEPRISISDVTRAEGRKGRTALFVFTVTLSVAYDQPVTISFATANGTATTRNNDYVARNGLLIFNPGETTKTITIKVKGDNRREIDETFYLDMFGNSGNSLIVDGRGIGTIVNDD